jgi:transcriptional regulator with XRE-family HTH domain
MTTRHLPHPLGDLLREWRRRRGWSQLQLAMAVGVSPRHLGFVEVGRSEPSRALVLGLAHALGVPLRDRNALLLAARYAPMYPDPAWDADEMHAVRRAVDRLLRQHEPYPALVLDRHWNVLQTNAAAPRFFGRFVDLDQRPRPRNLLHLLFDPQGLRPHLANWPRVARGLFERIAREAVGGVIDDRMRQLMAELRAYPDVDACLDAADAGGAGPIVPIEFIHDVGTLGYFSLVATVGTPRAIAAQELRVECMFPADAATEAWHEQAFDLGSRPP